MKKQVFIFMIAVIFIIFIKISDTKTQPLDFSAAEYYIANTVEETGALNTVTGIYLDYRYFDTIFEAGIFLVTVNGILFLSRFKEF